MRALIILTTFLFFKSSLGADTRCSGVPPGESYLFPYPGDCTRYVNCQVGGNSVTESCPDDQFFNEALQSCDHPSNSGCVPLTCPPSGVVDYYSYPGDCTRYIECYHGTPEVHNCAEDGYYFNAAEKRCVLAPESGCGEYSTTVEPTWSTPQHTACWGVLPGVIELKPYPGNCGRFIECIGADATEIDCPPGLYFDAPRQMCDQPPLSSCDDTTSDPEVTTPLNPSGPDVVDDPRCADGNVNYWPYVECSQFIECYQGQGYVLDCPSGLHFNENNKNCEDPSQSSCGRTVAPPNPNTTIPPNPDADCPYPSAERYLFPYPGDCTKFMECIDAQKVVQDCPSGLWFNPTLMVCDYPYEAGCKYA